MTTVPPMPEPPSMRDACGRLLPDAIGFARMTDYITALQDYATAGWVKFQKLEEDNEEREWIAERDALKAKLEEAEEQAKADLHLIQQAQLRETEWQKFEAQAAALAEALSDLTANFNAAGQPPQPWTDMIDSWHYVSSEALTTYREGR